MAEEPKRVVWRRRIAPIALLLAVGLLASRTCKSESAAVELAFDLGQAADRVRTLEVSIHRDPAQPPLGEWTGQPGAAPLRPWRLRLDPGSYRLLVRATLSDGRMVRFERSIEVTEEEARITVPLAAGLDGS